MSRKYLLLSALIVAFAVPASAANYYVAQNVKSQKCSVVTKTPNVKTATQIGPAAYKTKKAAQAAMKSATECKK